MYAVGQSTVHVADIGSETSKVGYAGMELPSVFTRRDSASKEGVLSSALERMSSNLEHSPLVYIEDPFIDKEERKRMFTYVMESSICSGVLFINGSITDCFSYGKSTGLVVRLCGGSTQVVPIIEGYCLSGGLKSTCGGESLTKFTREYLISKSKELDTSLLLPPSAIQEKKRVVFEQMPVYKERESYRVLPEKEKEKEEMEVARYFKESVSFIGHCQPKYYEFATGFTTRIFSERNMIPERLFTGEGSTMERLDPQKQITGSVDPAGLIGMIESVMNAVDLEHYDMLLGNIILTGGGSLIPGITERVQNEVIKVFPNARVKVANDRREFGTFFGGSILGSLAATETLMITPSEYSECGISALERKRSEWIK